jgi:ribonuclease HI
MSPHDGQRQCAIVINADISHYICDNSFKMYGRACSLNLVLDGRKITFISAHGYAGNGIGKYQKSIDDIEYLINARPEKYELMIGVDLNANFGYFNAECFPANVGLHSEGPQGRKGRLAYATLIERWNLIAANTICFQPSGKYTHWDVRNPDLNANPFDPRQIDFLLCSNGLSSVFAAHAGDSVATGSDHRPVIGKLVYRDAEVVSGSSKNKKKDSKKYKRKPVRWTLIDPLFNTGIMDALDLDVSDDIVGSALTEYDLCASYHIFTDGSYLEAKRCGWAFALFGLGDADGSKEVMEQAAGPVVILKKSRLFIGSERHTSCVAELNAVAEALLWLAHVAEQAKDTGNNAKFGISVDDAFVFTIDSMFVVKLLAGQCRASENALLASFVLHLWRFVGSVFRLRVRWSPGHDNLAKKTGTIVWNKRG